MALLGQLLVIFVTTVTPPTVHECASLDALDTSIPCEEVLDEVPVTKVAALLAGALRESGRINIGVGRADCHSREGTEWVFLVSDGHPQRLMVAPSDLSGVLGTLTLPAHLDEGFEGVGFGSLGPTATEYAVLNVTYGGSGGDEEYRSETLLFGQRVGSEAMGVVFRASAIFGVKAGTGALSLEDEDLAMVEVVDPFYDLDGDANAQHSRRWLYQWDDSGRPTPRGIARPQGEVHALGDARGTCELAGPATAPKATDYGLVEADLHATNGLEWAVVCASRDALVVVTSDRKTLLGRWPLQGREVLDVVVGDAIPGEGPLELGVTVGRAVLVAPSALQSVLLRLDPGSGRLREVLAIKERGGKSAWALRIRTDGERKSTVEAAIIRDAYTNERTFWRWSPRAGRFQRVHRELVNTGA